MARLISVVRSSWIPVKALRRRAGMSILSAIAAMLCLSPANAAGPGPTAAEQRLMASGAKITTRFESVSGLRAIVADNGKDKRLFYVTPDGKSLIAGMVFDASGRNVTTTDMARAGISGSGNTTTLTQLQAQKIWQRASTLKALKDGTAGPVVYAFIDPMCTYCHRLMNMARPQIAGGKVQLRWLPVTILSEGSKGLAEALYKAPNAGSAFQALATNGLRPAVQTQPVRVQLAQNLLVMRDTGERGVPVLVYRIGQRVVVKSGVPTDAEWSSILTGK